MSPRIPRMVFGLAAFMLVSAGTAGAATTGTKTPLEGAITLTGTDGKDDFDVHISGSGTSANPIRLLIEPAVTLTAAVGTCPADVDPVTGRPTFLDCNIKAGGGASLVLDLRKGDDSVEISDGSRALAGLTASAGAGNDTVEAEMGPVPISLKGEDGNDTLLAGGDLFGPTAAVVNYDGGLGVDTAGFLETGFDETGGSQVLGVTASLESKSANVTGTSFNTGQPVTLRTYSLIGMEGLRGTRVGDVLSGSTKNDTLDGNDGNDNLKGGEGDDAVFGGNGLDDLDGGVGRDSIDGGLGIDRFPKGDGGDTFNTRDGFIEEVPCTKSDTILDDLVDKVSGDLTQCSISTAAAKWLYDTHLSGRPAKIANGRLVTKVSCPELKPETCEGRLEALQGKRTLGHTDYKIRPGHAQRVRLPLDKAAVGRAAGKRIVLSAQELDADGRDRFVSRPTRVEKLGPRV